MVSSPRGSPSFGGLAHPLALDQEKVDGKEYVKMPGKTQRGIRRTV